MRRCACPRREPMDGMPATAKYRHGSRCRQRAYEARVKRAAEAAGLSVAPSMRAVDAARGTNERQADAESSRKRPQRRRTELRVSYRKAVEVLTAAYAPKGHEDESRQFIERTLADALPPRARAQVEQQRQEAA